MISKAVAIEMTDEEVQSDAHHASKVHNFTGLEEITEFIGNVNEILNKAKEQM